MTGRSRSGDNRAAADRVASSSSPPLVLDSRRGRRHRRPGDGGLYESRVTVPVGQTRQRPSNPSVLKATQPIASSGERESERAPKSCCLCPDADSRQRCDAQRANHRESGSRLTFNRP